MKRDISIAITWGLLLAAFGYFVESAFSEKLQYNWYMWVAIPIFEEALKFIGFRSVQRYTLIIAATFSVAEIAMHIFNVYVNNQFVTWDVAVGATIYQSVIWLARFKHITMWSVAWLSKFKWWGFALAVLLHSTWNIVWMLNDINEAPNAILALTYIPMFFVLMRYTRQTASR